MNNQFEDAIKCLRNEAYALKQQDREEQAESLDAAAAELENLQFATSQLARAASPAILSLEKDAAAKHVLPASLHAMLVREASRKVSESEADKMRNGDGHGDFDAGAGQGRAWLASEILAGCGLPSLYERGEAAPQVTRLFEAAWEMMVEQQNHHAEGWSMAKTWAFDKLRNALEPFRTEAGDELDHAKISAALPAAPTTTSKETSPADSDVIIQLERVSELLGLAHAQLRQAGIKPITILEGQPHV